MASQKLLAKGTTQREVPKIPLRKTTSANEIQRQVLRNIQNYSLARKVLKRNRSDTAQKSKENIKVIQVKMSPKTLAKVRFFNGNKADYVKQPTQDVRIIPHKDSVKGSLISNVQQGSTLSAHIVRPVPNGIEDIDKGVNDPIQYNEYASDVVRHLKRVEKKYAIKSDFLKYQNEANCEMRADLVDWVHRNASRFQLYEETYYLAVAIMDLYLQNVKVRANCLPLLGITAILIASKYEEVKTPDVSELVKIGQFRYSRSDILNMECSVLKVLDFKVGRPVPIQFLRRYSQANKCGRLSHNLSKFFLELSLLNDKLSSVAPSLLAAAASCLSLWVLSDSPWTPEIEYYSGYSSSEVAPVTKQLARFVQYFDTLKNQAVTKKFSTESYLKVAQLPQLSAIVKCFP